MLTAVNGAQVKLGISADPRFFDCLFLTQATSSIPGVVWVAGNCSLRCSTFPRPCGSPNRGLPPPIRGVVTRRLRLLRAARNPEVYCS